MRADAQRNRDALVAAAREAFAEQGAQAPLDDIARRAKVGAGTLYRHFPSRDALLAAVYIADIEELAVEAARLGADLAPQEALTAFLRLVLEYGRRNLGLKRAIQQMMGDGADFGRCRGLLTDAMASVLGPVQAAGLARTDLDAQTVVRLVHGVAVATEAVPELAGVMLSVIEEGLRPPVPAAGQPPATEGSTRTTSPDCRAVAIPPDQRTSSALT